MVGWLENPIKNIYAATNEDLRTIVTALAPTPQDTILAVCGSGDQGVALALHGARVICVDINPAQLEYASSRVDALMRGDTHSFLLPVVDPAQIKESTIFRLRFLPARNGYFLAQDNFGNVSKMGSVSFEELDIVEAIRLHPECNKVYLSNVLHCVGSKKGVHLIEVAIEQSKVGYDPLYFDARALDTIRLQLSPHHQRIHPDDSLERIDVFRDIKPYFPRKELSLRINRDWTPATYRIVSD